MAKHRTLVGLHARNAVDFQEADYELVRRARIETLKTMSHTVVGVYKRLRQQDQGIEFIVRLYDDRLGKGSRPTPSEFAAKMTPLMNALKPYGARFEIHNEPNHVQGIEGWGASDADARAFLTWYTAVLHALKKACPWAKLGFPGLAPGGEHRDLSWLEICREAIHASDFLGCHCYWQYENMLSDEWGLRFKAYHKEFPEKPIEITEFGNSTPGASGEQIASQYVRYYQELNKYPYLGSASAFIASSPDPAWAMFAWRQENGQLAPVVDAVARMERKAVEVIQERYFPKTGKFVRGAFLDFFERYGVALFGYPITEQFMDREVKSQYFQRAALEEYQPGKFRLKAIGSEVLSSRPKIAELTKRLDTLSQEPVPAFRAAVDQLSLQVDSLGELTMALQREVGKATSTPGSPDEALTNALGSLEKQAAGLQKVTDDLGIRLATALTFVQGDQAAQVAQLQAQVKALLEEVEKLKARKPAPVPTPGTGMVGRPTILDFAAHLPRHPTKRYPTRPAESIEFLIVHHSATPADLPVQRIAEYHVKQWDWPGIGYHYVVAGDGSLLQANDLTVVTNHAANCNAEGVGICFMGTFASAIPEAGQIRAGAQLIAWLLQELKLDLKAVKGHRECTATACPGDQWLEGKGWKQTLISEIKRVQIGA